MSIPFAKQIDRWEVLNRNLKSLIKERPELAVEQQQLDDLILEAKTFQSDQHDLLAKFREAVQGRRAAELAGKDLHERISSVLKGKLGFKSNDLYSYGLQPRRAPRRKKSATPAVPPAPTPSAEPGTPASHPQGTPGTPAGPAK